MVLIARLLLDLLGLLIFLFIFWKKMREDFGSEVIFKSASYVLFGVFLFYLFSFNFFPNWFLWFAFVGGVLGLFFSVYTQRIRFYEALEAFVVSCLPWVSIVFLYDSVVKSSPSSFVAFVLILLIIFGSYYLDANYKRFVWYKSGKIGISGLIILAFIFLTRSIVAFFETSMLSFVGNWELVISGFSFIVCIVLIVLLSKNEK